MKKSEFVTWPAEPSLNLIQVKPLYQDLQTWCVLAILAGLRWTCRHGQMSKISSRGVTVLFNVPQPQLDFFGPYGCVWKCRVPLNPMVLLIIIPIKWLFHCEYTLFSDKPMYPGFKNLNSCLTCPETKFAPIPFPAFPSCLVQLRS
jgi:hypothetical protein